MEEPELIRRAREGDGVAFGRLMAMHQPLLFGMLLRQAGQRQDAEDLFQDVCLQAYRHLADFRGDCKLSTWLYTIALNRVRNHHRKKSTRPTVSMDAPSSQEGVPLPQWADNAPTPEQEAERGSDIQALRKAVDMLGPDQKSIFTMHYFQYLPLEEVARRLSRPVGTVKVYLHRARLAVHKHCRALIGREPAMTEKT
jgi:RNA polymerase sigma-70 factor, ECF subfamily